MKDSRRRTALHGFTLIELLVCISAASLIGMLAISILVKVKQVNAIAKDKNEISLSLTRISDTWRDDVAKSTLAEADGGDALQLVQQSGVTVTYQTDESRNWLVRESNREGDVTSQRYRIPKDSSVRFAVIDIQEGLSQACTFTIKGSQTSGLGAAQSHFHLYAALHTLPTVVSLPTAPSGSEEEGS